jgi:2-keto-3-deoxy-L-rhamnonate aldolase RhmA
MSEYLDSANRDILVMVQIENKEAVENVHAIAAVDGIGQLFSYILNERAVYRLTELLND